MVDSSTGYRPSTKDRTIDYECESRSSGDWTIVAVRGEVDLATAPDFRRTVHELIDAGARKLAFDLSDLEFMDSTGLGVLIGGMRRIKEHDGTIVLAGLRPAVARVFQVTGLDSIFPIHDTLEGVGVG